MDGPICQPQSDIQLLLTAIIGFVVLAQQVFSYYRHQHIISDNKRLLHVIEAKTENVGEVK